jgi:hypothetical protein
MVMRAPLWRSRASVRFAALLCGLIMLPWHALAARPVRAQRGAVPVPPANALCDAACLALKDAYDKANQQAIDAAKELIHATGTGQGVGAAQARFDAAAEKTFAAWEKYVAATTQQLQAAAGGNPPPAAAVPGGAGAAAAPNDPLAAFESQYATYQETWHQLYQAVSTTFPGLDFFQTAALVDKVLPRPRMLDFGTIASNTTSPSTGGSSPGVSSNASPIIPPDIAKSFREGVTATGATPAQVDAAVNAFTKAVQSGAGFREVGVAVQNAMQAAGATAAQAKGASLEGVTAAYDSVVANYQATWSALYNAVSMTFPGLDYFQVAALVDKVLPRSYGLSFDASASSSANDSVQFTPPSASPITITVAPGLEITVDRNAPVSSGQTGSAAAAGSGAKPAGITINGVTYYPLDPKVVAFDRALERYLAAQAQAKITGPYSIVTGSRGLAESAPAVRANQMGLPVAEALILRQAILLSQLSQARDEANKLLTRIQSMTPDEKKAFIGMLQTQSSPVLIKYRKYLELKTQVNNAVPANLLTLLGVTGGENEVRQKYNQSMAQVAQLRAAGKNQEADDLLASINGSLYGQYRAARAAYYQELGKNPLLAVQINGSGLHFFEFLLQTGEQNALNTQTDAFVAQYGTQFGNQYDRINGFQTFQQFFVLGDEQYAQTDVIAAMLYGDFGLQLMNGLAGAYEGTQAVIAADRAETDLFLALGASVPIVGMPAMVVQVFRDGDDYVIALSDEQNARELAAINGFQPVITATENREAAGSKFVTSAVTTAGALALNGVTKALQSGQNVRLVYRFRGQGGSFALDSKIVVTAEEAAAAQKATLTDSRPAPTAGNPIAGTNATGAAAGAAEKAGFAPGREISNDPIAQQRQLEAFIDQQFNATGVQEVQVEIKLAKQIDPRTGKQVVSDAQIAQLMKYYSPDAIGISNLKIAQDLMAARLESLGYDLSMSEEELRTLQEVSVRANPNGVGLTPQDVQWLQSKLDANPNYLTDLTTDPHYLPHRGVMREFGKADQVATKPLPNGQQAGIARRTPAEGFVSGVADHEDLTSIRNGFVKAGGRLPSSDATQRLTVPEVSNTPTGPTGTTRLNPNGPPPNVQNPALGPNGTQRLNTDGRIPSVQNPLLGPDGEPKFNPNPGAGAATNETGGVSGGATQNSTTTGQGVPPVIGGGQPSVTSLADLKANQVSQLTDSELQGAKVLSDLYPADVQDAIKTEVARRAASNVPATNQAGVNPRTGAANAQQGVQTLTPDLNPGNARFVRGSTLSRGASGSTSTDGAAADPATAPSVNNAGGSSAADSNSNSIAPPGAAGGAATVPSAPAPNPTAAASPAMGGAPSTFLSLTTATIGAMNTALSSMIASLNQDVVVSEVSIQKPEPEPASSAVTAARARFGVRLVAYQSGSEFADRRSDPAAPHYAQATPADAGITYSVVANGKSSGEALELQVHDPSGKLKHATIPEGTVLEPVRRGSSKPIADIEQAGSVLKTALNAYCVNYAKLPPELGMLYRIAPQAVQDQFKMLLPVLQAARELTAAGRFTPDSDKDAYNTSIQQYALWAKIENWSEQQFARVFLDKTKENAAAAKVKWTQQMQQGVSALVPGRWRDISMVLDRAASLALPQRSSLAMQ